MAITGLVTGIAAFGLSIWGVSVMLSGMNAISSELDQLNSSAPAAGAQHAVTHQEARMVHQALWIGNS
jgi:hypothetical protein